VLYRGAVALAGLTKPDLLPPMPIAAVELGAATAESTPGAGVEILGHLAGQVQVRRPIVRLQFGGDRLAVLRRGEIHGIADQMDNAGLHDRMRKHRGDCLGKSLQAIDDASEGAKSERGDGDRLGTV